MFYDENGFHAWRFLAFLLLVCGLTFGIACAASAESPERDPLEVIEQQEESTDLYEPDPGNPCIWDFPRFAGFLPGLERPILDLFPVRLDLAFSAIRRAFEIDKILERMKIYGYYVG